MSQFGGRNQGQCFASLTKVRDVRPFMTEIIVVNQMQTPVLIIEEWSQHLQDFVMQWMS